MTDQLQAESLQPVLSPAQPEWLRPQKKPDMVTECTPALLWRATDTPLSRKSGLLEPRLERFRVKEADYAGLAASRHQRPVVCEHCDAAMHEAIMDAFDLDVATDPLGFDDIVDA